MCYIFECLNKFVESNAIQLQKTAFTKSCVSSHQMALAVMKMQPRQTSLSEYQNVMREDQLCKCVFFV